MTFADPPDMKIIPLYPPIFPFWVWSTFLHIGVVGLLSVLHFSSKIEPAQSVVKVTLIENTALSTAPSAAQPKQKPPTPKTPMLLTAPRRIPPLPQRTLPSPQPLKTPTVRTTLAHVAISSKPPDRVQPIQRRVLWDSHATNSLNLRNYLKVAQRAPASPGTSQQMKPPLKVSLSSAVLPTRFAPRTPLSSDSRYQQPKDRSLTPNVLKAMAPGTGPIPKSKVSLCRTIPPVYPRIARESGWEGIVLVRVTVQPDGSPDSIKVRKSSGHPVLDNAAVDAVKKWKFSPAKDGNIPIRSVVEIPINFDLRKQG